MATLKINGFEFGPFLEEGGFVYKRNDVDSSEAGEMADGTLRRDRVIIRPTIDVTIANNKFFLNDSIISQMSRALEEQWLDVEYFDIRLNKEVTRTFYTNNITISLMKIDEKNKERRWQVSPFTLVAKGVAGDGRGGFSEKDYLNRADELINDIRGV